ncbi:MAG: S-layer homology domain-containing protein, partial [Oscillospiraceae bacterium]|nr:S-layer homology domain-containing protein [Oscillospiraceae bacterium]
TYIAYYNHMATWFAPKDEQRFVMGAVNSLANAYLYTGDEKYGRVGAVVLDRVADIYPELDLRTYPHMANTSGGAAKGKAVGSIWETYVTEEMARAYDMLFPMYDDPQVVEYIAAKAEQYNIEKKFDAEGKVTPETIRKNLEDGICLEIYKASADAQNQGNFGLHQLSVTLAGIALDNHPETDEMLDWVFGHSETDNRTYNTGGGVNEALISDVTRDGQGTESPQYNLLWVTQLIDIATTLANYDEYEGMALFDNPKYVGMIKSYAPLTLVKRGLATIGDSGFAVHFSSMPDDNVLLEGFKYTGDEEIAQHLYMLKDRDVSELHYDIFTRNPESVADEIEAIIEAQGEYNYDKSSMLTGFGFAALRAGTLFNASAGSAGIKDTMRDFTIYFGGAASHSHCDMLNLGVEAYGIGMTTDLGYPEVPSATDPNRHQWITPTISHNTVVVNEQSQNKTEAAQKPLHFDAKDTRVKVMDVEAPEAYGECDEYRRTVVMVDYDSEVSYGIDFFRILGGSDHLYSFHANSETHPQTSDDLSFEKQIGGTYAGASVPFGADPYTNTSSAYGLLKYPLGYTWLFDVYRADNPRVESFYIDYEIEDFRKHSRNPDTDMRLRMTMVNDFKADEVTLASGLPTRIAKNEVIDHLEYMLVRRKGKNLDTLFATVIEPYNKMRYIKEDGIKRVDVEPDTSAYGDKRAAAVKVELKDGRVDYIVYAQDNSTTYTITDPDTGYSFFFRGFVGVWTVKDGVNVYSYVNDGEMIGDGTVFKENMDASVGGTVVAFQDELSFDNWIEVELDREFTEEEARELVDRMINVERIGSGNSAFMITGITMKTPTRAVLDLGGVTTIAGFVDNANEELGYEYDVAVGRSFEIPMSYEVNPAPVFDETADNITTSAGSSVSVKLNASSEEGAVVYSARTLPRGASFNTETGIFTWKPDASQIGESLVAVDATDEYGRSSTQYFTVTVYGSTTSKPSEDKGNDASASAGSSGGGGGGGGAPDSTQSDEKNNDDSLLLEEKVPSGDEADEVEKSQFTDLSNHVWASDAINALAADGIIKGTTASTFSPAANITRADFALLLVRVFNLTSDDITNFDDVSENDYFASELAIARNTGIVNGIGDNRYAPRNTITRQDMMVMVYRAMQSLNVGFGENSEPQYIDFASVAAYAQDAVSALIGAGIVNGKNGLIAPVDYTTRAEVAVLIKRVADYVK